MVIDMEWWKHLYYSCVVLVQQERIYRYQMSEMVNHIDTHVEIECCFFVFNYLSHSISVFLGMW